MRHCTVATDNLCQAGGIIMMKAISQKGAVFMRLFAQRGKLAAVGLRSNASENLLQLSDCLPNVTPAPREFPF